MRNDFFHAFYTDLFDRVAITDARLQVFTRFVIAALTANGPVDGIEIEVPAHSQNVSTFADFGAADMLFLYVKNETTFDGNWEVRVD